MTNFIGYDMQDYKGMTDEQLQSLAAGGDAQAEEILIERYTRLVRVCARPYFLAGGDSEDLTQEGLMGLLAAVRGYSGASGSSFRAYAEVCIRNRIVQAVRSASRKKHDPLNGGVSLEYVILSEEESEQAASIPPELYRRSPEEQLLERESEKEFYSTFSRCLSSFETEVLFLFLDGLSYRQIAARLDKNEKAVDNAVQRIRRKLARQKFPGDISRR